VNLGVFIRIVSLAGAVSGQESDSREGTAMKACLAGDVHAGVSLLAELYRQSGDATALYNQARCFQWNARYDEALGHFREYLRQAPSLSNAERAEVNQHIAEVERARGPGPLERESPPPLEPASRGLLTAAGLSAAAGVALLGVGTGLAVQAQNRAVEVARAPAYDPGRDDQVHRQRATGTLVLAAGGAALIAGGVLWLLHRRSVVAPGADGLALVGGF
jgi:hypothetical protein